MLRVKGIHPSLSPNFQTSKVCTASVDVVFTNKVLELRKLASEVEHLNSFKRLSNWDLYTNMPKNAIDTKAWHMNHLTHFESEKLRSRKTANLLKYFKEEANYTRLELVEQALVRELERMVSREKKLPARLLQEQAELFARAVNIWSEAKATNNFSMFAPTLERVFALKREQAEELGYEGSPYNALFNEFEPTITTDDLDNLFSDLKEQLVPLIRKIQGANKSLDASFLIGDYSPSKQVEFSKLILQVMGFDLSSICFDEGPHPDCLFVGPNDIRIVTQIDPNNPIPNITSTTHEGGHGLYYYDLDESIANTPLGTRASWGMDEGQARFYETFIGLGLPFWTYFFPKLKELFPAQLDGITLEDFYKAINKVEPSFIRIDADEVTYNLHIIVRYEVEKALIEGKLKVSDAPKFWNQKMSEYLGIRPRSDKEGILQDMHWADNWVCFFPAYTLGNIYAAQLYHKLKEDIPDVEEQITGGDLTQVREWLKEHVHKFGKMKTPQEIIKDATGEPLSTKYFLDYIKQKLKGISS